MTLLLTMASKIYSKFKIEDEITFNIWYKLLENTPFDIGLENLNNHMLTSEYPPKPANLVQSQTELSWHQYQQQEAEQSRLALQAYHENEDVKPMPDYVREKLEQIGNKFKGGEDSES